MRQQIFFGNSYRKRLKTKKLLFFKKKETAAAAFEKDIGQEGFLPRQTPTSTVRLKVEDAEWRMGGVGLRVKNEG